MGPKGGKPTASDALAILERRRRVAAAYLKGRFQHEIASVEGVSQVTISNDLKAIQEQWKLSAVADIDILKRQELARLDNVERTYWEAWERSCRARERTRTKKVDRKDANTSEASLEREQRDGDPRFLEGVRWCIERRCKVIGLDAPVRNEHGGEMKVKVSHGIADDLAPYMDAIADLAAGRLGGGPGKAAPRDGPAQ